MLQDGWRKRAEDPAPHLWFCGARHGMFCCCILTALFCALRLTLCRTDCLFRSALAPIRRSSRPNLFPLLALTAPFRTLP